MDITPLVNPGINIINAYGSSGFTINKTLYPSSVICLPTSVHPIAITSLNDLDDNILKPIIENKLQIDLILLGSGATHSMLPTHLKKLFAVHNINCEIMNLGAACRTYNVLISEERKVTALLIKSEITTA